MYVDLNNLCLLSSDCVHRLVLKFVLVILKVGALNNNMQDRKCVVDSSELKHSSTVQLGTRVMKVHIQ